MTEQGNSAARIEKEKSSNDQAIFGEDPITPDRIKALLEMPEEAFWDRAKQNFVQYYPDESSATNFDTSRKMSLEYSWNRARTVLEHSDVVVFTEGGGLGDMLYILLEACVVAARYPEKKLLIDVGVLGQLVRKDLADTHPNLIIVQSQEQLVTELAKAEGEVAYLDMGASGANTSTIRAAELYKQAYQIKKETQATREIPKVDQSLWSRIRRVLRSRKRQEDVKQEEEVPFFLEKERSFKDRMIIEQVGMAGQGMAGLLPHLIEDDLELRKFLSDVPIEFVPPIDRAERSKAKSVGYNRSTHQLLARPAKLRFLLGLENASDFLNYNPFELPPSGQKSYDLVIIYDAASSRDKVLSAAKMTQFVEEFRKKHPDAKIGVVVGRTNPEIAEEVFGLDATLTPIQGEVTTVFAELMKSKAVVSVDTVWQHLINFAHHFTDDAPELMTLFSTDAGFPPGYFRPDQGKMAVVKGSLDTCDPKRIVTALNKK